MATGRSSSRWARVYASGYDLSGFTRELGELMIDFEATPEAALSDAAKGALPGQASIKMGALNAFLDNTANGLHTQFNAPGVKHVVSAALGMRADPAAGDPVFVGEWSQLDYTSNPALGGNAVPVTVNFGEWAANAATTAYAKAWGVLLHPDGSETVVNNGTADHDNGAQTTAGGYAVLHGLGGDGQVVVSIEASATNTDAAFDLAGDLLTFGSLDFSSRLAAVVALATNATVERYLRWQIAFAGGTTATFALSFVRG